MYLRVKAISPQAGIKWLQIYTTPLCPYVVAVHQIHLLVCMWKAHDVT